MLEKQKELIINQADPISSLILSDQTVEAVNCFKYLGTHIDDKLSFTEFILYVRNLVRDCF